MKKPRKKPGKKFNWWYLSVPFSILLFGLFFWYLQPSPEQEFINQVVEGSSSPGATLLDGFNYALEQLPDSPVGKGISWSDVTSAVEEGARTVAEGAQDAAGAVRDFSSEVAGNIEEGAKGIVSKFSFRVTNVQKATKSKKFKILIIGNNMNHRTTVSWCREIKKEFAQLAPYSQIKDQFTIDCGTFPFTVGGVSDRPESQALMLLMAKLKKQELGYDYVLVLHKGPGRSFALPTFASLVYYKKGETVRIFMHEFSHLFAGLADEYSSPEDIRKVNSILEKLGIGERITNQLDYYQLAGLIDPPNCIKKTGSSCGAWYEGCALVSQGVCRPSQNSMMREHLYEVFNQESTERILEVAQGKRIVTGSGIFR